MVCVLAFLFAVWPDIPGYRSSGEIGVAPRPRRCTTLPVAIRTPADVDTYVTGESCEESLEVMVYPQRLDQQVNV